MPTSWFAGIATAIVLIATAAFGGIATVEAAPLPELEPGEPHVNDQFSTTVRRAVLIDDLPGSGVFPEAGQRVLSLVVDAENRWTRPLSSIGEGGMSRLVELADLPGVAAEGVARYDDATASPWLQPEVPATLVLSWAVDANRFGDGDELVVRLSDASLFTGTMVVDDVYWAEPIAAATVRVRVEDVGSGSGGETR
ncbi:hypothetical protein FLP10_07615 [Agromyces intestinalis]|uniref:Uncharacterized protein n=1 Tax=Agromyces intestinalis TaxID=2592652 RepID=A0A5C1YL06_9MICO|nr:hypothetical protein FLP10_07615 [Agromyces intestinalis]